MKCEFEVLELPYPIWDKRYKNKKRTPRKGRNPIRSIWDIIRYKCNYKVPWLAISLSCLVIVMCVFLVVVFLSFRQPSENVNVPEKQINEWWLE